ncbi:MAG: hypothetical protein MUC34_00115 [Anaerolineae bacterium]|jgi:hypothetical protein|nr:hypothetical protein [Anaerolineae bacterium]
MSRQLRHLRNATLAAVLALSSATALAQSGGKSYGPPPGHDMNEQNMNAPGMRELMNKQQGTSRARSAAATGHDMNEQNEHAPGMHERMRREAGPGSFVGRRDTLVIESLQDRRTGGYAIVDNYNP